MKKSGIKKIIKKLIQEQRGTYTAVIDSDGRSAKVICPPGQEIKSVSSNPRQSTSTSANLNLAGTSQSVTGERIIIACLPITPGQGGAIREQGGSGTGILANPNLTPIQTGAGNPPLSPQQLLQNFLDGVHNYRLDCKWDLRPYALQIFALPVFTSSNPNQPCNFICGRIQHFTNLIGQAGPNSASVHMWTCKLNFFQALAQFYNC